MFDSVRFRLTLWYVAVLALVLIAFSSGVYALLAQSLYDRLDSTLRNEARALAAAHERQVSEGKSENEAAIIVQEERFFPRQATAIFKAEGQLLEEKPTRSGKHARLPPLNLLQGEDTYFYTVLEEEDGGRDGRRIAVKRVLDASGKSYIFAVSQPLDRVAEELESMRHILYIAVPLALALAGFGGWFLARRSLAPVVAMSEQARRISAENLEERLPLANARDELGKLAATFNELLTRLETSFNQQRRFMADASHELRTPLSVIRTATDVTLGREHREESEYRDALKIASEQTHRLTRIVEDMFTLARADAGSRVLDESDFYLDELINETARAATVLAVSKGLNMDLANSPEMLCHGDEGLLRQMLMNLLGNAIKHTPRGGTISMSVERLNGEYQITVADTGPGIPSEAQPHIFERFFRADSARARTEQDGGGAGLGLAIARWIAEVHKGRLELLRSDPTGTIFVASLPAPASTSK
ncbi:MAG TPA: ATP-binding protein [Pyrinomonadaceae bacterium]|nr:ATP-binding protein [Pyrinomonadaceae bacterium]